MILVLFICRFGSKEKDKNTDRMTFLLMAMPLVSVVLIVVDMLMLGMGEYQNFNSGQFLRTAILLVIVNIAIFLIQNAMPLIAEATSDSFKNWFAARVKSPERLK